MKLGTVVYQNKLYNLDCMEEKEIEELLNKVQVANEELVTKGKSIINNVIIQKGEGLDNNSNIS